MQQASVRTYRQKPMTAEVKDKVERSGTEILDLTERELRCPYCTGDQLWQKTFATDVIPFCKMRNKGQKPQYFAEDCGPAIIDKETYQRVQMLIAAKKEQYPRKPEVETVLRGHVCCAECGSLCKRKVCNGTVYWVCRRHDDGESNCPSRQISETTLEEVIRRCYGKLFQGRDTVLRPMLAQLEEFRERELRANSRIGDIDRELARLAEQNLVLNRLKDKGYVDPALYRSQQDELSAKALELRCLRRNLMERTRNDETIRKTETMLDYLEDAPEWLDEIERELFDNLIDHLMLTADGTIKVRLINGLELTERLEVA